MSRTTVVGHGQHENVVEVANHSFERVTEDQSVTDQMPHHRENRCAADDLSDERHRVDASQ